MRQAIEILELRLTDEQIPALRLRDQRRKRENVAEELKTASEIGVVNLGVIDSEWLTLARNASVSRCGAESTASINFVAAARNLCSSMLLLMACRDSSRFAA